MTDKYLEMDTKYCSQGDTSGKHNPKKIFEKADGNYLIDDSSTKYLDMQMFNSAANFGYKNAAYNQCILEQLEKLPCLAAEFMNKNRILLSEKISQYMLKKYNLKGRVHFTVGGAQAVDDALKLAINYTKNRGIITFEGSYHGRTMASSSVSSSYRYTRQFGSVLDTYRIPFPNCHSCVYDKKEPCELYCIKQIQRLFESEFRGVYDTNHKESRYQTFLFEPILGRGGYVFPHENYYAEVFKLFKKYHIVTIADEVQMGFYRTGTQWSFEHYGIVPDIIVFGKAITNGLWPLSGIWAKEEIISPELWPVGSTHCTFSGHPLGTAIGLKTFELLENQENITKIRKSEQYFYKVIQTLNSKYSFIKRAQVKGHAAGLELYLPNGNEPATEKVKQLIHLALTKPITINGENYGLILTAGGMFNNSLMLSPSVYISESDLNLFAVLLESYINMIF